MIDPVTAETARVQDDVARALDKLDVGAVRARYREQGEFIVLEQCFPDTLIERFVIEVDRVRPAVHRNYIPRHKKGGSVSAHVLAREAPALSALYGSTAFLRFLRAVTGQPADRCPARDPHACALYFYTEPGDHIGFHYDTSYYRGTRYTVLLGLIERSSSRLVCRLHTKTPGRAPVDLSLATNPGTLVLFNGDLLWHAITPLGEREERVSLTMEFVTDAGMTPAKRLFSDLKDAVAYFGFRSVFARR